MRSRSGSRRSCWYYFSLSRPRAYRRFGCFADSRGCRRLDTDRSRGSLWRATGADRLDRSRPGVSSYSSALCGSHANHQNRIGRSARSSGGRRIRPLFSLYLEDRGRVWALAICFGESGERICGRIGRAPFETINRIGPRSYASKCCRRWSPRYARESFLSRRFAVGPPCCRDDRYITLSRPDGYLCPRILSREIELHSNRGFASRRSGCSPNRDRVRA